MRTWLALAVVLAVAVLVARAAVPSGAGVYYDDGVYLAIAQSLAEGDGYSYANLPGDVPAIKYPPLYPVWLAAAGAFLPEYPANLPVLKRLNALLMGIAAGLAFLLFTRPRESTARLLVFAAGAVLGHASAQSMSISTVLLSEPLFLVIVMATLLKTSADRGPGVVTGLLAVATFLTRGIGLALVAAVVAAPFLERDAWSRTSLKRNGGFLTAALAPVLGWWAWTAIRRPDVPAALAGNYGSYTAWFAAGGDWPASIGAHLPPLVLAAEQLWVPDAAVAVANPVLLVLAVLAIAGMFAAGRRNPALALFPMMYLAIVLVWPYEPDRFYYAILPLLTMFVIAGGFHAAERVRDDLPKVGRPAVAIIAGLLLFNSAAFQIESRRARTWAAFQVAPAAAYGPLLAWIRDNTLPDAVIASGLDPLVYWETGRRAVPGFQFFAEDFRRSGEAQESLADQFEEIRALSGARWVAVIRGEGKAGRTMEAFADRHPERTRSAFEAGTGPFTGVVYEVLPPGEAFPASTPPSPR